MEIKQSETLMESNKNLIADQVKNKNVDTTPSHIMKAPKAHHKTKKWDLK